MSGGLVKAGPPAPLAFQPRLPDNEIKYVFERTLELTLAAVASRSSLAGALLRTTPPSSRQYVVDFLRGLSRDELECIAEFQGSCLLEAMQKPSFSPYELLLRFFDSGNSERWHSPDDRSHKTCLVLAWLERSQPTAIQIRIRTR